MISLTCALSAVSISAILRRMTSERSALGRDFFRLYLIDELANQRARVCNLHLIASHFAITNQLI